MPPRVQVEVVSPRLLAAVGREVAVGRVREVWGPALDQVWAFLRSQPGLRTDGHNIFVYHHPARDGDPMHADFGVEVTREFAGSGEVRPVRTPGGEAAVVRHVGPYDGLAEAHGRFTNGQGRAAVLSPARRGRSTMIGTTTPTKLETLAMYLLC